MSSEREEVVIRWEALRPRGVVSRVALMERLLECVDGEFVNVDLLDALLSVADYNTLLDFRATCRALNEIVLRTNHYHYTIKGHISNHMSDFNHANLARHRKITDDIVARVTPYADTWSAMADPLLTRWLRMRLDVRLMDDCRPMPDKEVEKEIIRSEELRTCLEDNGYTAFFTPMTITSIKRRWDWRRTEAVAKAEGLPLHLGTPMHEWLAECIDFERTIIKFGRRKCALARGSVTKA